MVSVKQALAARPWWGRGAVRLGGLAALLLLGATAMLVSIKPADQPAGKAEAHYAMHKPRTKGIQLSSNTPPDGKIMQQTEALIQSPPGESAPARAGYSFEVGRAMGGMGGGMGAGGPAPPEVATRSSPAESRVAQLARKPAAARDRKARSFAYAPQNPDSRGLGEAAQAPAAQAPQMMTVTPMEASMPPAAGMSVAGTGEAERAAAGGMRGAMASRMEPMQQGQASQGQGRQGQIQGRGQAGQGQGQSGYFVTYAQGNQGQQQGQGQSGQTAANGPNGQQPNSSQMGNGFATDGSRSLAVADQKAGVNPAASEGRPPMAPPIAESPSPNKAKALAFATDKAGDAIAALEPPQVQAAGAAPVVLQLAEQQKEVFLRVVDNPFRSTKEETLSTFSIDVDTASYANVRRYLGQNLMPPKDAVRIEELLNYFPYNDPPPAANSPDPFNVRVEVAGCPWNAKHRLARIGLAARPIDQSRRSPSNLVFLVDVSGSMNEELPLIKWGLSQLVEQLNENDRVAIVVYASALGLVLPSKSCEYKAQILSTIEQLQAGGSTNGGAGIQLAYDVAAANFIKNGTNRVIWATDGDLNVGVTTDQLPKLVQEKAKSGVFLTVLGCGEGNLKNGPLEQAADQGNGVYNYIDSAREAYRILVEQMGSTLVTVAKDVKIQVEFNASRVLRFRLIGYENRIMAHEDFRNDAKDAGDIGAGHHVTALYEIEPGGPTSETRPTPSMTVRLRYKKPNDDTSPPRELAFRTYDREATDFGHASDDLKLASAVAGFGMLLRDSPYKGSLTYAGVLEIAQPIAGRDPGGYRKEFVELVRKAQMLSSPPK